MYLVQFICLFDVHQRRSPRTLQCVDANEAAIVAGNAIESALMTHSRTAGVHGKAGADALQRLAVSAQLNINAHAKT